MNARFMASQNAMLRGAPRGTDIALTWRSRDGAPLPAPLRSERAGGPGPAVAGQVRLGVSIRINHFAENVQFLATPELVTAWINQTQARSSRAETHLLRKRASRDRRVTTRSSMCTCSVSEGQHRPQAHAAGQRRNHARPMSQGHHAAPYPYGQRCPFCSITARLTQAGRRPTSPNPVTLSRRTSAPHIGVLPAKSVWWWPVDARW